MCTKGFKVVIELDVHAVTCPGVWLCPNGKVCLKIRALGFSSKTKFIPPVFPLLFHEQFVFEKLISTCRQLADLQKYFGEQLVYVDLIQKAGSNFTDEIALATFEIALIDVLYPSTSRRGVLTGVDVDLLMEPSCHFPGIIAPKVEISTKTTVEEINLTLLESRKGFINPKTLRSKTLHKHLETCTKSKLVRREHCNTSYHGHPICHCCSRKIDRPPFVVRHKNDCDQWNKFDAFNMVPQLPALQCHRWAGKKLLCQHFRDEDWHKRQTSKNQKMMLISEADHQLHKRPASSGAKYEYCECAISHRSGSCAVCNLYKKYFPKNHTEKNGSPKYICHYGVESNSNPQLMDDNSCSDLVFGAKPSKSCEIYLTDGDKQHFTDYGSRNRLTCELSRRVRRATGRVGYPFLQADKEMCKCCTCHVHRQGQQ